MSNILDELKEGIDELKRIVSTAIPTGQMPNDADQNQFLTVAAAAEYLGLKTSTIYAYTRNRKIRHYKRGSTIYFKKSEINAYIEAGLVESKGASNKRVKQL
ncbi:helix-turn-helix domain-containing protein [Dyadobacter chenwenxiniae]|uniref:Helix-turn-helix domain-containing protein n=1 Tax=Dyadobacter chenwenxiniae TaxID=2906456 RepID=A0A9X1PHH9_9BACT|nr:helix-turn-helix domain-containing protein [Dyadobacter chenwenxiniae]MCF0060139.1 helix-turn-helix domain-containing protein [Dyadobacter chenwenxiniae]UON85876.1 helix-turn-helix domain-containing protein [Dyadobacter chenwenxiniae]